MTVQNVIDLFKIRFPEATAGQCLTLFNQVHKEVCDACRLRIKDFSINVTAGVFEYDLDNEILQVNEVYWVPSADYSSWMALKQVNYDSLAENRFSWKSWQGSQSSPTWEYYIRSKNDGNSAKLVFGMIPSPGETTAGGYPYLQLTSKTYVALDTTDNLPHQILNEQVYLAGMCAKFAMLQEPETYALYTQIYSMEQKKNTQHVQNTTNESPVVITSVAARLIRPMT